MTEDSDVIKELTAEFKKLKELMLLHFSPPIEGDGTTD